jgi:hypothetical protein
MATTDDGDAPDGTPADGETPGCGSDPNMFRWTAPGASSAAPGLRDFVPGPVLGQDPAADRVDVSPADADPQVFGKKTTGLGFGLEALGKKTTVDGLGPEVFGKKTSGLEFGPEVLGKKTTGEGFYPEVLGKKTTGEGFSAIVSEANGHGTADLEALLLGNLQPQAEDFIF